MNKIIALCSTALIAAAALLPFCGQKTAAEEEVPSPCTAEDVELLQAFLLGESTDEALTGKPYDRNGDGVWDVFDLSLMKREVFSYPDAQTDTLVVYFSRTGNTEKIAASVIDITGADSCVIEAAVPYSDEDIQYSNSGCRANQEQNDKSVRPEIAALPESLDGYDTIFLGYPIWWGEEPRIIDTFLESYDFSEKTVIPFCTSASSAIGKSEKNIAALVPIGNQLPGRRFAATATKEEVQEWIDSLPLSDEKTEQKIHITVKDTTLTAVLSDTQAAAELAEKLAEGTVTVTLNEYGGFEKVGKLPWELTKSDVQTVTVPGDIMLYRGGQMTIFYNSNSWSYTSLGHIEGATSESLAALFGKDGIEVTLSLA